MIDFLMLDLVDKGIVVDQIVLNVGYDIEKFSVSKCGAQYKGTVTADRYGGKNSKHAHRTTNLKRQTSSGYLLTKAVLKLYNEIVNPHLLVRRITMSVNRVASECDAKAENICYERLDLFWGYE